MRCLHPVSNGRRTIWAGRTRFAFATLLLALAGPYCWSVGQTPRQLASNTANIDAPATLDSTTSRSAIPLPVESLRAIHSLDLEQPPKTKLPKLRLSSRPTRPTPSRAEPKIMMPALIAPRNHPAVASKTASSPPDDQPPTMPRDFEPEWRPGGKSNSLTATPANPRTAKAATPPATPLELRAAERNAKPLSESVAKTTSPTAPVVDDSITPERENRKPEDNAAANREAVVQAKPLKPLTRNQIFLRNKLRKVLTYYYRKPLNSRDNDAWEAMHGMLAYGLHSRIRAGGPQGEPMTAIGWLCYNNPCKNKQLMRLNEEGEIRAQYGVGLQGHMGQFLAMLAQCNVDPSYPIRVDDREFTIHDLITSEQDTCYPNTELTFKLIGLMHYLPSDTQWVNDRGETWSMERLIEEELKQPIRGAACGGTHRLGGLSLAVRKRQARGEPVDGAYLKAAQFTNKYEQYCYRLQNSDGSFSTSWFDGPGREKDIDRRCRTSGHLLEWILYQVEDEQLDSYRVVKGVDYLTNLLYSNSKNEWEIGPLCHALHALALYDQRKFEPYDKPAQTAKSNDRDTSVEGTTSDRTSRRPTSNRSAASPSRPSSR